MLALWYHLFYVACDPQNTFWEVPSLLSLALHLHGLDGLVQELQ